MEDARPGLPPGVDDRDADCWEPLVAIADAAGDDWPMRARSAATALVVEAASRNRTSGVQLLADLFKVFDGADKLATETILEKLHGLPESAWADIRGKPLNDRGLATRLKKYGVAPKVVRIGTATPRGYEAVDLHDPWKRYYLPHPEKAQQAQQLDKTPLNPAENREKPANVADVADVALFPGMGEAAADIPAFLRRCTHCGAPAGADNPVQEVHDGDRTTWLHRGCQTAWLGATDTGAAMAS
jgi:hypothetical protein